MRKIAIAALTAVAVVSGAADAGVVLDVWARANSSTGGTGLNTGVSLSGGQTFTVTASPTDLWNAGGQPAGWSNANGQTGSLQSSGSDESSQAQGTPLALPVQSHSQNQLTAPVGALVGEINEVYFLLGTDFSGPAPGSGTDILTLYFWDNDASDNQDRIAVTINAANPVPEPASLVLIALGLFGIAAAHRRRLVPSS